jgi:hypothetical protein
VGHKLIITHELSLRNFCQSQFRNLTTFGSSWDCQKLQETAGETLGAGFMAFSRAITNASLGIPPDKRAYRYVWSAAELQAKNGDDSWSALMYSALSGVSDSGP